MLPPLYKFRSINERAPEKCLTLDSLRKSYVYYANVTTLNDPFEMGAYLDQVSDLEAAKRDFMNGDWAGSAIGEATSKMGPREKRAFLEERWNNHEWREMFIEAWKRQSAFTDDMKMLVSIFCSSATRTDGLLWSHYGDGHRGIAIGFNANADRELSNSREVLYDDEFPVIDMLRDSEEDRIRKGVLTKSSDWRYEKEFRSIYPKVSKGIRHEIDPSAFVSITFGARATPRTRDLVIAATRPRLSHVRFEVAKLGKKSFDVSFE